MNHSFWDIWGPWITGGGFVGFVALLLSYIARPSSQTIADLRQDVAALEERRIKDVADIEAKRTTDTADMKREHAAVVSQLRQEHAGEIATVRGEIGEARREIGTLRESNFHMRVVFTALSVQYNLVRQELLKRDPDIKILTIKEIVEESHVPLQSVTMFDPAQVGFLWATGQGPPSPSTPKSSP